MDKGWIKKIEKGMMKDGQRVETRWIKCEVRVTDAETVDRG